MANKNYTNYSKSKKEKPVETIKEVAVPSSDNEENTEPVITEVIEDIVKEPKTVLGTVANCEKLNIRSDANKAAEILCIINKGEIVEIDEKDSSDDFYAIIYGKSKEVSITGYCMKQYIKLNK